MDYQTKDMIINALMKVVKNAPTNSTNQYAVYSPYQKTYDITKEQFDIWINYVYSILKIISSYVDVNTCLSHISNIIADPYDAYASKINTICQKILDFARTIISM